MSLDDVSETEVQQQLSRSFFLITIGLLFVIVLHAFFTERSRPCVEMELRSLSVDGVETPTNVCIEWDDAWEQGKETK